MTLPTASALERASLCIGSAVLPRAESTSADASRGTAIHAYLEALLTSEEAGAAALEAMTDRQLRAVCGALVLDGLPLDPASYVAEVAFAYDVVTGKGRELGRGLARDYSGIAETEIAGTADVVALVGRDSVLVGDYKTGFGHVTAAARNWQLRMLALAAARAYGRHRAVVEIIRPREDRPAWRDRAELDGFDLAEIAEELRGLVDQVVRARAAYATGQSPTLSLGEHCRYCHSIAFCPAQTGMLLQLASAGSDMEDRFIRSLTPESAAVAHDRLTAVEKLVEKLREHLAWYAKENPFPTSDGRIYGPVLDRKESLDGAKLWHLLKERYGEETAWSAAKLSVTKTALLEVAGKIAAKTKAKKTHINRELLAELASRGGVHAKTTEYVRAHNAKEDSE